MRIDKPRRKVAALCIDLVFAGIFPDANDDIFIQCNVRRNDLVGEHIYHVRVFNDARRLPIERRANQILLSQCMRLLFNFSSRTRCKNRQKIQINFVHNNFCLMQYITNATLRQAESPCKNPVFAVCFS